MMSIDRQTIMEGYRIASDAALETVLWRGLGWINLCVSFSFLVFRVDLSCYQLVSVVVESARNLSRALGSDFVPVRDRPIFSTESSKSGWKAH